MSRARRRYAGILVDIYDLITCSPATGPIPSRWPTPCRHHRDIADRLPDLPGHARPAMTLMASEDWLASYARLAGIADVPAAHEPARPPAESAGGGRGGIHCRCGGVRGGFCRVACGCAGVRGAMARRKDPNFGVFLQLTAEAANDPQRPFAPPEFA